MKKENKAQINTAKMEYSVCKMSGEHVIILDSLALRLQWVQDKSVQLWILIWWRQTLAFGIKDPVFLLWPQRGSWDMAWSEALHASFPVTPSLQPLGYWRSYPAYTALQIKKDMVKYWRCYSHTFPRIPLFQELGLPGDWHTKAAGVGLDWLGRRSTLLWLVVWCV